MASSDKHVALQDLAASEGICYGCGSSQPHGLHVKSHWHEDDFHQICTHVPDSEFTSGSGLVYCGLIEMLVDCHSNWTAMAYHHRAEGRELRTKSRIECVTGSLGVKSLRPMPMGVPLTLKARARRGWPQDARAVRDSCR